jgi:cobalt transporter subunit CbtB
MQGETVASPASTRSGTAERWDTLVAAAMAALLGSFLIWGVGFAPIAALHDAAHDTRHSLAFPCH